MLSYNLDKVGEQSLYEYLYNCIKQDILDGRLITDEHLPSKRTLAKNLGVSIMTIENAYGQLLSEGYIYSLPRKGFYVAAITGMTNIKKTRKITRIEPPKAEVQYKYNLASNETPADAFPFSIWARMLRKEMSENKDELMKTTDVKGTYELRQAIASHLESFRNIHVDPDRIIIGAGTEYLYGLLIQLLGRKSVYGIENPGYSKIAQIYSSNGIKYDYISLDNEGMDINEIKKSKANIIHISPTHHYPTGITMPIKRRYELLRWAEESLDRYIIEDDYDTEFRMTGKLIPAMQSIDVNEKVIYINTFSKTLTPTIRISYMILPSHLLKEFNERLGFYACTVSNFEQYTLASFIREGYFEKHLNRMRIYYAKKRETMIGIANKYAKVVEADSGLHFILELKARKKGIDMSAVIRDAGINLHAVSDYAHGDVKTSQNRYIVNYSNLSVDEFEAAMKLIRKII